MGGWRGEAALLDLPRTSTRPKSGCLRTVSRAEVMELGEVTSSATISTRELEGSTPWIVDGLRAVATTRCVGWAAMNWARDRPRPDEHPVMSQTASSGRLYPALFLPACAMSERLADGGVICS